MRSFFRLALLGLVLLVVALVSALAAMQFAIHGTEVNMPNLVGKTPMEARKIAEKAGLPMELERQYYSSIVAEGRILSQTPPAGMKVRRGWQVRVAESLGPQRVEIPNVLGDSERAAEINIRRRGLEVSAVAQVALEGSAADRVLSQSPPANATDVAAPKISLLVSDAVDPRAFVMPSFVGQALGTATSTLQASGFHVEKVSAATSRPPADSAPLDSSVPPAAPSFQSSPASIIVSQSPTSGQKVVAGELVSFTVR